jgi:ATP-dependent Clp protease ATP-binding subunit ClpC
MKDIHEKFTTHLKNVLVRACALASELGRRTVRLPDFLYAIATEKGSIGAELLTKTHCNADELRTRLLPPSSASGGPPSAGNAEGERPRRAVSPRLSAETRRAIEKAVLTASLFNHHYVGTEHLLSGLIQIADRELTNIFSSLNIDLKLLKQHMQTTLRSTSKFPDLTADFHTLKEGDPKETRPKSGGGRKSAKTPALDYFTTDLTNPKHAFTDSLIGRNDEIERLVQILSRKNKNNPILIGEPGVGKTAIVEGLAKRMMLGTVPEVLLRKRVLAIDMALIVAGTMYRGEFEGRLKQIIDEVRADPNIILFIDEIHSVVGAGAASGSLDAATILKPALARGEIRCIGATTPADYKKHLETDPALERRFQPITVSEPTPEETLAILRGIRPEYEQFHGVTISDEALATAVSLAERYRTDRYFPDKAIDLVDEAAAAVRVRRQPREAAEKIYALETKLQEIRARKQKAVIQEDFSLANECKAEEATAEKEMRELKQNDAAVARAAAETVGKRDVAAVAAQMIGIPVGEILARKDPSAKEFAARLGESIIGQDEAIAMTAKAVLRARSGLAHPERPLASLLYLGPTGVGKTELAKTLARALFHHVPDSLIRIDMSEFSEPFQAAKLVGAPAGYVGFRETNKLTDAVRKRPHSVVLFDEIEKAHPDVLNLLLQVLEDGMLTDATGRRVSFRNAYIVMTSNIGARNFLANAPGFLPPTAPEHPDIRETAESVRREVRETLRPEFVNRIDAIVVFHPLDLASLMRIVDIRIADVNLRLGGRAALTLEPAAREYLARKGLSPSEGARAVRRAVEQELEDLLATELLAGAIGRGSAIAIAFEEGKLKLSSERGKR